MDLIIKLLAGAFVFWLIYWYLEVYTPRKHMREAIAEVSAMFPQGFGKGRPRPPASAPRFPPPPPRMRPKRIAVKKTPGRMARVPHA